MRETIAIALANWDGWDFADLSKEDTAELDPSQATYREEARQILEAICSEIEKVGLSDEEIEQVVRQRFPVFEMNEGDEEERDASAREICQAQLQKILTLLKK